MVVGCLLKRNLLPKAGEPVRLIFGIPGLLLMSVMSTAQELEPVAIVSLTEGPTVDRAGNVYFTDFLGNRIMKFDPAGVVSIYREDANVAVGLVIDQQNRLVAAEGGFLDRSGNIVQGTPRLTRTDLSSGEIETLVDNYKGTPFTLLNDVTLDSQGRLYFTDYFGSSVYRVDAPGQIERILDEEDIEWPNGIQISPGDSTLYVVGRPNRIYAFDLDADGTVHNGRVHYEFDGLNADGMSIDIEGNLYATAKPPSGVAIGDTTGVHVVSPDGELLQLISIPDSVRNITFAGPDMKTMYVTAGSGLYKLRSEIAGLPR